MRFDWDKANTAHIARHGITPSEAEHVILNAPLDLEFETWSGEERTAQVGESDSGRILVVLTTIRDDLIRVVTAFPAAKRLRTLYIAHRGTHEGRTEEEEIQE